LASAIALRWEWAIELAFKGLRADLGLVAFGACRLTAKRRVVGL